MSRRILITGSKKWNDDTSVREILNQELSDTPEDQWLVIIHGGNKGVDQIADAWAYDQLRRGKKVRCEQFCTDDSRERNALMVKRNPEKVHGFPLSSKRARHCMTLAASYGIPVIDHSPGQNQ